MADLDFGDALDGIASFCFWCFAPLRLIVIVLIIAALLAYFY